MYYTEQLLGHVAHNNSELRAILNLMEQSDDESKITLLLRINQLITCNDKIIAEILEYDDTIDSEDFKKTIEYLLLKTNNNS